MADTAEVVVFLERELVAIGPTWVPMIGRISEL
jgi:hypothetical protein